MNENNQMYMLFKNMKEAYKDGRNDIVESYARNWLLFNPENPFQPGSPEHEVFFQMQRCFTIWRNGDINARINKRKMAEWAIKLCEINPKQPYRFDKKAEEEEKLLKAKKEQELLEQKKLEEEKVNKPEEVKQEVILGVIPENKKPWFKKLFARPKEGEQNDGSGSN